MDINLNITNTTRIDRIHNFHKQLSHLNIELLLITLIDIGLNTVEFDNYKIKLLNEVQNTKTTNNLVITLT